MEQAILNLEHLSKSFDGKKILDDLSIDIGKNEFVTLLGPSGCGKTTTLRMIGGFIMPDEGRVICEGKDGVSEVLSVFAYECCRQYCLWIEVEEKEQCLYS